MTSADDRQRLSKAIRHLDEAGRGVGAEDAHLAFREYLRSICDDRVLGDIAETRVDYHLRGYARDHNKLEVEGVMTLMLAMWAEGFTVGHKVAEGRYT